jgi:hypothetical protein
MATTRGIQAPHHHQRVSERAAIGVVGVAWAASTLLAGIMPDGPYDVALLLLAAAAVGALLTAGFDRSTCGLSWSWPSAIGLAVAVGYAALAAPAILLAGTFTGLDLPRLLLLGLTAASSSPD